MSGEAFFKPAGLAVMLRETCSECGSRALRWLQLVDLLPLVRVELRADLHDLVGFMGPDASAWLCSPCGAFGAFGAPVLDGFA